MPNFPKVKNYCRLDRDGHVEIAHVKAVHDGHVLYNVRPHEGEGYFNRVATIESFDKQWHEPKGEPQK